MFDLEMEMELLERCAAECALISGLAIRVRARNEIEAPATECREIARHLKIPARGYSDAGPCVLKD